MCTFLSCRKIIGELGSAARMQLRRLGLLALWLGLSGCSFVQTVYNQSPDLLLWWLDSYVDLQAEQRQSVQADLQAFQQWHRQEQLPQYAQWLQQMQAMARQDLQEEQVCQLQADILSSADTMARQMAPAATRLAQSLSASQMRHLRKKLGKSNEDWRREWMEGSTTEQLERRVKKALERAEDFYGRLDTAQRTALSQWVANAGLEVSISEAERQRRQRDMLDTVLKVQEGRLSEEVAQRELRQLLQRSLQSPEPTHLAHAQKLIRHNCRQITLLHNITTAAQRQKAVERLQFYEKTARTLASQR